MASRVSFCRPLLDTAPGPYYAYNDRALLGGADLSLANVFGPVEALGAMEWPSQRGCHRLIGRFVRFGGQHSRRPSAGQG